MREVGVDLIWSFADLAFKTGPMFSPRVHRRLLLPRPRPVADAIRATGLPWIFHSGGNLMPVIDDLLALGMNGLHPSEPGATDNNEMKRRFFRCLCLAGNIGPHYNPPPWHARGNGSGGSPAQ
jgi:uroporphyrinogen decarboxylase